MSSSVVKALNKTSKNVCVTYGRFCIMRLCRRQKVWRQVLRLYPRYRGQIGYRNGEISPSDSYSCLAMTQNIFLYDNGWQIQRHSLLVWFIVSNTINKIGGKKKKNDKMKSCNYEKKIKRECELNFLAKFS